jgi:hypothetical protein
MCHVCHISEPAWWPSFGVVQVAFMRNEKPLAVSAGWEHTLALVEVR